MNNQKRKRNGEQKFSKDSPKRMKKYITQLSIEIYIELLQYINNNRDLVLLYTVLMQSKKLTENESNVLYKATNYCLSKLNFFKYKNFNKVGLCGCKLCSSTLYLDSKYYINNCGYLYKITEDRQNLQLFGRNKHITEPVYNCNILAFATTNGLTVVFKGKKYFFKIIVKKLECGNNHLLILTADNEAYGFGDNTKCQLSKSIEKGIYTRLMLITVKQIHSISAGGDTSAIVTYDGNLYLYGMNQERIPWKYEIENVFSVIVRSNNVVTILTSCGNVYYILQYYSFNHLSQVKKLNIPKACRIWREISKTIELTVVQVGNYAYIVMDPTRIIKYKKVLGATPFLERIPKYINLIKDSSEFGISNSKGKLIIEYREKYGYFNNEKDILKIPGIGKKTIKTIMEQDVSFRKPSTVHELKRITIKNL